MYIEREGITGRDAYIVRKALAYAIASIGSLPNDGREESDRLDMVAILKVVCPDPVVRQALVLDVQNHTGAPPDLTD
jgi:hypothetical protein